MPFLRLPFAIILFNGGGVGRWLYNPLGEVTMPYNDYMCLKCGKLFQDIDAWKDYCSLKNCPTKYKDGISGEDRRKIKEDILNSLPPRKPTSKWVTTVTIIVMSLVLVGVIYGVVMLIKWLISVL